eukprot:g1247.t1
MDPKSTVVRLGAPNGPAVGDADATHAVGDAAEKLRRRSVFPWFLIRGDGVRWKFSERKGPERGGEVDRFPNLFVSRTFSKTWGIPSLRLGYLVSTKPNVDALTCVRGPYDINQSLGGRRHRLRASFPRIAVVGITAALKQRQYVFEYVREDKIRRFGAVACFIAIEKAMIATGLSSYLPITLLGMFSLFGFLLLLEVTGQPEAAMGLFRFLEPGYRFLLKWAPVFFTPALATWPVGEETLSHEFTSFLVNFSI